MCDDLTRDRRWRRGRNRVSTGKGESKCRMKLSADEFVTCFPIDLSAALAAVVHATRWIESVTVETIRLANDLPNNERKD